MVNTQTIPASAPAQDPIARDFTQISNENPEIRRLTMGYGTRRVNGPGGHSMSASVLRLQGAWLERAGSRRPHGEGECQLRAAGHRDG